MSTGIGGVGGNQPNLSLQEMTRKQGVVGRFVDSVVNWFKSKTDGPAYFRERMDQAGNLFEALRQKYGDNLANMAWPQMHTQFLSSTPLSEIARGAVRTLSAMKKRQTENRQANDATAARFARDLSANPPAPGNFASIFTAALDEARNQHPELSAAPTDYDFGPLQDRIEAAIKKAGGDGDFRLRDQDAANTAALHIDAFLRNKVGLLGMIDQTRGLAPDEQAALRRDALGGGEGTFRGKLALLDALSRRTDLTKQDRAQLGAVALQGPPTGADHDSVNGLINAYRFRTSVQPHLNAMADNALEKFGLSDQKPLLAEDLRRLAKDVEIGVTTQKAALRPEEAQALAEAAVFRAVEGRANLVRDFEQSGLPEAAVASLRQSALSEEFAVKIGSKAILELTGSAEQLFRSVGDAATEGDVLNALRVYSTKVEQEMSQTSLGVYEADELMTAMEMSMKAALATVDDQKALQTTLDRLLGPPGRAVITGLVAARNRTEFRVNPAAYGNNRAHVPLKNVNFTGFMLARNLSARLDLPESLAHDLTSSEGIDSIDDLPQAVHDFARSVGMDLKPNQRMVRQQGADRLFESVQGDAKYQGLDLTAAQAFLNREVGTATPWPQVMDAFDDFLTDQLAQHRQAVGSANDGLVNEYTRPDGPGGGEFRNLFSRHAARVNQQAGRALVPLDADAESIQGEALASLSKSIGDAILAAGNKQMRAVPRVEAAGIADRAVAAFLDGKAAVLDGLGQAAELSDWERDGLAQQVWTEPRWGTPANDATRLVNELRGGQLDLAPVVAGAVQDHGLPGNELNTAAFVQQLRSEIIPAAPQRLTLQAASDLARAEVDAFCRDKAACLDRARQEPVTNPALEAGVRRAVTAQVLSDPTVRSANEVGQLVALAARLDDAANRLTAATTPDQKIDAQFHAFDTFNQACQAAGVQGNAAREAFLGRALDVWAGGLGDRGTETLNRLVTTLTSAESLKLTAGIGALGHEKPSMRVTPLTAADSPFLQSVEGLDGFVRGLAVAAARAGGKTPKEVNAVGNKFENASLDARIPSQLHPAVVALAESRGLQVPRLRFDQGPAAGAGDFSTRAVRRFEEELNEKLGATPAPDAPLSPVFLADIARTSVFELGNDTRPWPPVTATDERQRRFDAFFGDDLAGRQAVAQLTNQTLGNGVLIKVLMGTPFGPFKVQGIFPNNDPAAAIPPNFKVSKTPDGGYRVAFAYDDRVRGLNLGGNDEIQNLNDSQSRLAYGGAFVISGDSIRQNQPRATVESLTYDYAFHAR